MVVKLRGGGRKPFCARVLASPLSPWQMAQCLAYNAPPSMWELSLAGSDAAEAVALYIKPAAIFQKTILRLLIIILSYKNGGFFNKLWRSDAIYGNLKLISHYIKLYKDIKKINRMFYAMTE
jgi:hypothetical protein